MSWDIIYLLAAICGQFYRLYLVLDVYSRLIAGWDAVAPAEPPTLREAMRHLATLGGFRGRKSDGEPRIQALWRGLQRPDDITAMCNLDDARDTCLCVQPVRLSVKIRALLAEIDFSVTKRLTSGACNDRVGLN